MATMVSATAHAQMVELLANVRSDIDDRIALGSFPTRLTRLNDDTALFVASTPTRGTEVWRTDGTWAGTAQVTQLRRGAQGGLTILGRAGDKTVIDLAMYPFHEVWLTDGTLAGNVPVTIPSLPIPDRFFGLSPTGSSGDALFAFAYFFDGSINHRELWSISGSAATVTRLLDRPYDGCFQRFCQPPAADGGGSSIVFVDHEDPIARFRVFARAVAGRPGVDPIHTATSDRLLAAGPPVRAGEWICLPALAPGQGQDSQEPLQIQFYRLGPGSVIAEPFGPVVTDTRLSQAISAEGTAYVAAVSGMIYQIDPVAQRVGAIGTGHRRIAELLDEGLPTPWATLGRQLLFASGGLPGPDLIGIKRATGDFAEAAAVPGLEAVSAVGGFGVAGERFIAEVGFFDRSRSMVAIEGNSPPLVLARYGEFAANDGLGRYSTDEVTAPILALSDHTLLAVDDPVAGTELWRTDGTPEGTHLVRDINTQEDAGFDPLFFAPAGARVVMTSEDGPVRAVDPATGVVSGLPGQTFSQDARSVHATLGSRLYFGGPSTPDSQDVGLWETDGTALGSRFTHTGLRPAEMIEFGGNLLFSRRAGPDFQTGFPAAAFSPVTRSVSFLVPFHTLDQLPTLSDPWIIVEDQVFFASPGPGFDSLLFRSDGTPEGTLVVELPPSGIFSRIFGGGRAGRVVVALRHDDEMIQAWRTDGTQAGTTLLTTFPLDGAFYASGASTPLRFIALVHDRIFSSDGTVEGTRVFSSAWSGSTRGTVLGDSLLLIAADAEHGAELWSTDGIPDGTGLVMDINPGQDPSDLGEFELFRGRAYFAAYTPEFGRELWSTDGTGEGTRRVTDIAPGSESSTPSALAAIGTRLYFAADDGFIGREPYYLEFCGADVNADGVVNPDDLSDFITCFFLDMMAPGTCVTADFNGDGSRDPDDLGDFIVAFFASNC